MKKVVVASILLFFGCQLLPVFANEVEEIFAENMNVRMIHIKKFLNPK